MDKVKSIKILLYQYSILINSEGVCVINSRFSVGIIIAVFVLVVLTSGCLEYIKNGVITEEPKKYSGYGVSFTYPGTWEVTEKRLSSSTMIWGLDLQENRSAEVLISRNELNGNDTVKSYADDEIRKKAKEYSYQLVSNETIIDGISAYDYVYTSLNKDQQQKKGRCIYFEKNGYVYEVGFQAYGKDYDYEKYNFEMIINSLKLAPNALYK